MALTERAQPKRLATGSLTASDAAGGVFSWSNKENATYECWVDIRVTTVATSACTIDVGATATSAATSSDTLLDNLDVNAAVGFFSRIPTGATDHKGTNGKNSQRVAPGEFINASKASGATAGLVGKYDIWGYVVTDK